MSTELRLARNSARTRSLNERVALISESFETFGSLKFMCECGIHKCGERIELSAGEYDAIRLEPTHFLLYPGHVLPELGFVVECTGSHVVVERRGTGARIDVAIDRGQAKDEPLSRDTDALG